MHWAPAESATLLCVLCAPLNNVYIMVPHYTHGQRIHKHTSHGEDTQHQQQQQQQCISHPIEVIVFFGCPLVYKFRDFGPYVVLEG